MINSRVLAPPFVPIKKKLQSRSTPCVKLLFAIGSFHDNQFSSGYPGNKREEQSHTVKCGVLRNCPEMPEGKVSDRFASNTQILPMHPFTLVGFADLGL